jgi:streptogramin lyase
MQVEEDEEGAPQVPPEGAVAAAVRRFAGLLVAVALVVPALPAHAATPTVTMFNSGIPNPAILKGMTAGPDGKVWFADWLNNSLGAVTLSSGAVNELPAHSDPVGVTGGVNGNLYFALSEEDNTNPTFANHVGVMNPATGGFGTTWYGGGNQALPRYPAVGPDGNVWVTEPRNPGATTGDDKLGLIESNGNPSSARRATTRSRRRSWQGQGSAPAPLHRCCG